MKSLSAAQQSHIISLLNAGNSAHEASSITCVHHYTIPRICRKQCPYLPKSSGGCPAKISDRNVNHAIQLISSGKADTAVEVGPPPKWTHKGPHPSSHQFCKHNQALSTTCTPKPSLILPKTSVFHSLTCH